MSENTPNRKSIRDRLLGVKHVSKTETIVLFGEEVELRQPSLEAMMDFKASDDPKLATAEMIIRYVYVPGTEERLFEAGDVDAILKWPFGDDLMRLQNAIQKLTGVDISEAEKVLQEDPFVA